jgi:hypothetical protein
MSRDTLASLSFSFRLGQLHSSISRISVKYVYSAAMKRNVYRRCSHITKLETTAITIPFKDMQAKAVLLHAIKELLGRGSIAPTHSRRRH